MDRLLIFEVLSFPVDPFKLGTQHICGSRKTMHCTLYRIPADALVSAV